MNNADSTVGATEVLDRMHLSTHRTPAADAHHEHRRRRVFFRAIAVWSVIAASLVTGSSPAAGAGMTMTPNSVSAVCNGSYVALGKISGAGANEPITFASTPATNFLPAYSSSSGNYNVIWKCGPGDIGRQFDVVATGSNSGRSTTFTVFGEAPPVDTLPSSGTNLLANPGIESGSVSPWKIIEQSSTTTLAASTAVAPQAGSWALQSSSGTSAGGSVGQDVVGAVQAGQTFTASIWARHPHTGGTPQSATVVLETIGGTIESSVLAITVTDVWQRFDVTLSVANAGHTGLRTKLVMLTAASAGRGTYLIDSAELVESSPDPFGALEVVTSSAGDVRVVGYAIDPNSPHASVPITIMIGTEQSALSANVVRPDVAAMYPSAGPVHGFDQVLPTQNTGTVEVCAHASNLGAGANTVLGCSTVTVASTATTVVTTTPPTTATPTTAPATTAIPTTTELDPLGPQALDPVQLQSLFAASNLAEMTSAYDFEAGDADTLRLYWAFFNREPDIRGAKYWISQSRAGMTLDDMAYNFAESVEFGLTYGSVTDHEFLEIVYRNVLGRRYDAAGYEYWLTMINRGLPRSGAVRWIAANAEFVTAHPYQ